jgi:hypothetical protein
MKKYKDDIVIVTLLEGPEDYCANIEQKLRPAIKIGWNIHVGGNKGFKGDTHSDEAKHKISVAGKGRKFSDEHKKKIGEANRSRVVSDATRALQSDRRKGLPRGEKAQEAHRKTLKESPWRNATANHFVWSMAGNFFEEYLGNLKLSAKGLAKVFELKETQVTTILEKFRGGWKPYEDSLWMDFKTKYEEVHSVS